MPALLSQKTFALPDELSPSSKSLASTLSRGLPAPDRGKATLLQASGLSYEADPSAPAASRLLHVRVGETPLRPEALYRVAVSSHLAAGGDGFLELSKARRVPLPAGAGEAPLDADALAAHLARLAGAGVASAPASGRIVLRPPS